MITPKNPKMKRTYKLTPKEKPKKPKPSDGDCKHCGSSNRAIHDPKNKRTTCFNCGAYVYDWVRHAEVLAKIGGPRSNREKVRPASFAPPELLDITKTDLADLVWRLAERCDRRIDGIVNEHALAGTLREIVSEYERQRRTQKTKPHLPRRLQQLMEKLREERMWEP